MSSGLSLFVALAVLGFIAVTLLLMLVMALVQPIWCIFDCALDERRGALGKVIWIALLVLLYGVANWFYGAFAAHGKVLLRVTRLAWLVLLLLVVAFFAMYLSHDEFKREIDREWQDRPSFLVTAALPAAR